MSKEFWTRFVQLRIILSTPLTQLQDSLHDFWRDNFNRASFTKNHHVLTANGFKPINLVNKEDYVAVLAEKTYLVYRPVKQVYRKKAKEKVLKIESRFVGLEVTLDHFLYVFKSRVPGKKKGLTEIQAKDLYHTYLTGFQKTAIWEGEDVQFYLPETNIYRGSKIVQRLDDWEIPMDPFLKFFGFYIAEGWVVKNTPSPNSGGRIEIAQTKAEGRLYFENLMKELGISDRDNDPSPNPFSYFVRYDKEGEMLLPDKGRYFEHKYRIYNKQLFAFLLPTKAPSAYKQLPSWVWSLNSHQCQMLMEGAFMGDGDENGCYYTSSYRLADDIMRLSLHAGFSYGFYKRAFDPNNIIRRDNIYLKSLTRQNWPIYRVTPLYKTRNLPVINNDYYQERETDTFIEGKGFLNDKGEIEAKQRGKPIQDLRKFQDDLVDYEGFLYDIETNDESNIIFVRDSFNYRGVWTTGCKKR